MNPFNNVEDVEDAFDQRIARGDWTKLPPGYYALPIHDDNADDMPLLGFRLYRRQAIKTTRTGRVYGRDKFTAGAAYIEPGIDPDRLRAVDDDELRILYRGDQRAWIRGQVGELIDAPERYMALYGRIFGRCGRCHRVLRDAKSKLRGIGPECLRGSR